MSWPFSEIVITYISTPPSTTSTATLAIPANSNFSDFVSAISRNGFWTTANLNTTQPSSATFVPPTQIVGIAAQ